MAEFRNSGYRGLYNGETADDMFKRKHLQYREDILDNRRRWISCESILDNVQTEKIANDVHYEVWEKVRKAIADIGGMMKRNAQTWKSLKTLEKEQKQLESKSKI